MAKVKRRLPGKRTSKNESIKDWFGVSSKTFNKKVGGALSGKGKSGGRKSPARHKVTRNGKTFWRGEGSQINHKPSHEVSRFDKSGSTPNHRMPSKYKKTHEIVGLLKNGYAEIANKKNNGITVIKLLKEKKVKVKRKLYGKSGGPGTYGKKAYKRDSRTASVKELKKRNLY